MGFGVSQVCLSIGFSNLINGKFTRGEFAPIKQSGVITHPTRNFRPWVVQQISSAMGVMIIVLADTSAVFLLLLLQRHCSHRVAKNNVFIITTLPN